MKDTIGRKGMPDLWTFGRPYRSGICQAEFISRASSCLGRSPYWVKDRRSEFKLRSREGVGSFFSFRYMLVSRSNKPIFPSYLFRSRTTEAQPLSDGRMTKSCDCFNSRRALPSAGEIFGGGSLGLRSKLTILSLTSSN